jgi:hypothetical protein
MYYVGRCVDVWTSLGAKVGVLHISSPEFWKGEREEIEGGSVSVVISTGLYTLMIFPVM